MEPQDAIDDMRRPWYRTARFEKYAPAIPLAASAGLLLIGAAIGGVAYLRGGPPPAMPAGAPGPFVGPQPGAPAGMPGLLGGVAFAAVFLLPGICWLVGSLVVRRWHDPSDFDAPRPWYRSRTAMAAAMAVATALLLVPLIPALPFLLLAIVGALPVIIPIALVVLLVRYRRNRRQDTMGDLV